MKSEKECICFIAGRILEIIGDLLWKLGRKSKKNRGYYINLEV